VINEIVMVDNMNGLQEYAESVLVNLLISLSGNGLSEAMSIWPEQDCRKTFIVSKNLPDLAAPPTALYRPFDNSHKGKVQGTRRTAGLEGGRFLYGHVW
jgi:hypothetical protein